ncbi:MAG: hypothetical protein A2638_05940 [Nitrospirae bacterium RIFCSPHIGHO2_01_FULL_66_17]|nr:MAG: hypothetical protein A2638_05940 [Nitrospirae bacterium RIFCSPHIGHO2_01_FULL_66_17]
MSLEGSIKDFGLSDIFQLIQVQQKSGVMSVRDQSWRASVGFVKGMVVSAQVDEEKSGERIGGVLVRARRLTPQQLQEALKAQQETGDYLGQILVARNIISEADLKRALRLQILEAVYRLFRWKEGRYSFDQKDVDYPKAYVDPISTEHILMEGVRRLDEWPYIEKKISSLSLVFAQVAEKRGEIEAAKPASAAKPDSSPDDPFADLDTKESGRFSQDEIAAFHAVNGSDDVSKIIDLVQMGEFEVCKALSNLLTAGLIVPVGAPAGAVARELPEAVTWAIGALMATGRWTVNIALIAALLAAPAAAAWRYGEDLVRIADRDLQAIRSLALPNQLAGLRELVHLWTMEHGQRPDSVYRPIEDYGASSWPLADPWGRPWRDDLQTGDISSPGADEEMGTSTSPILH